MLKLVLTIFEVVLWGKFLIHVPSSDFLIYRLVPVMCTLNFSHFLPNVHNWPMMRGIIASIMGM
jgi:hypothetical protein